MHESFRFFWSLAKLASAALWPQMGTNGVGGTLLFVVPLLVVLVSALRAPRGQKWATVVRRRKEELFETFIASTVVVVALFMWEFSWKQPNIIREQAGLISPPELPRPPVPVELNSDGDSIIQDEIEGIKKQLQSMSAPVPSAAFSVKTEFEMSSFGAPGKFMGFFVGYKGISGYVLFPVTHFLFVRITNLLPVQTMVERLQIALDDCSSDQRLEMIAEGEVFFSTQRGYPGSPAIGHTLLFKDSGTGRAMAMGDINGVDLSRSARLDMPFLDQVLSERYLKAGESVGGWIFFSSPCMGRAENFTIEDVAGRTFKYRDDGRNEMKSGDLSVNKIVTVAAPVDLSGATIRTVQ
jgi:hypothetical protein